MSEERESSIEEAFVESWRFFEQFFRDRLRGRRKDSALRFIEELRRSGYDRRLRAGQSLTTLVLSREREHGIEPGRPLIGFWFDDEGMTVTTDFDREETYRFSSATLTPEVEAILERLCSYEIR